MKGLLRQSSGCGEPGPAGGTPGKRARYLLLDGVACTLVGTQLPSGLAQGRGRRHRPRRFRAAALISWGGRTTSATSVAMLNSSFIQGFERDDYHPLATATRWSCPPCWRPRPSRSGGGYRTHQHNDRTD
jgi:hypothetical protein